MARIAPWPADHPVSSGRHLARDAQEQRIEHGRIGKRTLVHTRTGAEVEDGRQSTVVECGDRLLCKPCRAVEMDHDIECVRPNSSRDQNLNLLVRWAQKRARGTRQRSLHESLMCPAVLHHGRRILRRWYRRRLRQS